MIYAKKAPIIGAFTFTINYNFWISEIGASS